jgi:hypothetical protein
MEVDLKYFANRQDYIVLKLAGFYTSSNVSILIIPVLYLLGGDKYKETIYGYLCRNDDIRIKCSESDMSKSDRKFFKKFKSIKFKNDYKEIEFLINTYRKTKSQYQFITNLTRKMINYNIDYDNFINQYLDFSVEKINSISTNVGKYIKSQVSMMIDMYIDIINKRSTILEKARTEEYKQSKSKFEHDCSYLQYLDYFNEDYDLNNFKRNIILNNDICSYDYYEEALY